MNRLGKFRRLGPGERVVLVQACLLLIAAEIGLRVLPFRTLLRWSQKKRAQRSMSRYPRPERIAELVEIASRAVGRFVGLLQPTCLRKSIALCVLLSRRNWDTRLVLGTGSFEGRFQAHAWVELGGKPLGADESSHYKELAVFPGQSAGRASERQIA